MNVLVTGCAGFIGCKVSEILLDAGHTVVGVDNLNDAYDVRLKKWRLSQIKGNPGFTFHQVDIVDRQQVAKIFRESPLEAVVNLAARAGVRQSVEDPWCCYETNVFGNLNLLERCRETGVKKFVLASTSSVYGERKGPFREDSLTDCPLSPYAASKKAAEVACYTYHRLHSLDVSVLRYFTVYGPAGRPDMSIFRFIRRIADGDAITLYGDGSQERDFTYVDDIARGTKAALKPLGFEAINLGSNRPLNLREVIRLIEENLGKKARVEPMARHPADVPATWAEVTKARRLLDWQPLVPFQEGLRQAVEWYRRNRDWARQLAE
jgi:nucleoside-diphosphate-sugar epimerase